MKRNLITCLAAILFSSAGFAQTDTTTNDRIFERVETEASFPGGQTGWRRFLEQNLNPAVPVDHGAPAGKYTVWAQFIVGRDGSVSDIKVLTKLGFGMEQEVLRVLRKSGNWSPAEQSGRTVKAYRKQPITFIVEDDDITIETKENYTLYQNVDNPVTISVAKIKPEDLIVTVSIGTITKVSDGKYTVNPGNKERIVFTVSTKKKGEIKELGQVSFEVIPTAKRDPGL